MGRDSLSAHSTLVKDQGSVPSTLCSSESFVTNVPEGLMPSSGHSMLTGTDVVTGKIHA